jgi:P27 family predicted phage terminase small subunit
MKGRKPKPVQTKIAEGDRRGRGVHKLDERLAALPKALRGLPGPPAHLSAAARDIWHRLREQLAVMEQDYAADATILEGLCVNYVRAVEADLLLERDGCDLHEPIVDRTTGDVIAHKVKNHPAVARSNLCWRNVQMFASDLGLTLVSRQRLTVDSADTGVSDLMEMLSGPYEKKKPPVQ